MNIEDGEVPATIRADFKAGRAGALALLFAIAATSSVGGTIVGSARAAGNDGAADAAKLWARAPLAAPAASTAIDAAKPVLKGLIRLAQAKPKFVTKPEVTASPGATIAIPVSIASEAPLGATAHVIIDGTPEWMSLSAGESVGDGVWLLRANQMKELKLKLSPNAKGERKMGVLLVDKDGKITAETQFSLKLVAAAATDTKGQKTWQSMVDNGAEDDAAGDNAAAAAPATEPETKPATPPLAAAASAAGTVVTADKPKKKVKQRSRAEANGYAKYLVRECTTCHSLFGQDVGIPVMVGLKVDRFIDTMDLYRRGKRDNLVMINVSRSLDDDQIKVLAEYLGRITPAPLVRKKRRQQVALAKSAATGSLGSPGDQKTGGKAPVEQYSKRKITEANLKRAERWVAKAQELLRSGRIAQARLWLRRATDYGIAEAAMLLGTSYDPNFLRSNAGIGLAARPAKARKWYLYARKLGSQVAVQRLAGLPAGRG